MGWRAEPMVFQAKNARHQPTEDYRHEHVQDVFAAGKSAEKPSAALFQREIPN
jgi:hypothetical protein